MSSFDEKAEKTWPEIPQPEDTPRDATHDSKTPKATGRRIFTKSDQHRTFDSDSGSETFYKPIDSFEGRHRWDPEFEWTEKEERRLVRKIDLRICTWVCLMFLALQLDRGNISQALSDNMLDDLGLSTNDYNTGQTIFYLCFLFVELPSQLISKKLGPDRWIPIQMVFWSLVASCQAFLSGRESFWTTRALLGLIEGDAYFYTSKELPIRLSACWMLYQFTSIISAFLAYGILQMGGINGLEGWRWLFALEGSLTGLIGIASAFYLPPSPYQTASRFRGKNGWFNGYEEKMIANRILRDDPSKGEMHNRQAIDWQAFWWCLTDYHMWPIFLLSLTWLMPSHPMAAYLTLTLRDAAGFGTFQTNLLTIPAYVLFICTVLFFPWLTEKLNERFMTCIISQVLVLPFLIALEVLPKDRSPWATYALSILVFAEPYFHPVLVAITSRNAGSVRTRTVASALYNKHVQASNIISSNIYRTGDAPFYYTGNKVLIAIACYNILLFLSTKIFYVKINASREKKWSSMSKEEKDHYLATTTDRGNKWLDFRFAR